MNNLLNGNDRKIPQYGSSRPPYILALQLKLESTLRPRFLIKGSTRDEVVNAIDRKSEYI